MLLQKFSTEIIHRHSWSQSQFGSQWETAKCFGICTKVSNKFATVLWDLDKTTTKIELRHLKIENSAQPGSKLNKNCIYLKYVKIMSM